MTDKRIKDFEADGFSIYEEPKYVKPSETMAPPHTDAHVVGETKIIVVDTKEVLHAVAHTNVIVKQGIENSNLQLQAGIEKIVQAMGSKPDSFTLDIKRDQRGFMTSIDVKINK